MDKNEKYEKDKNIPVSAKIKPKKLLSVKHKRGHHDDEAYALPPDVHGRLQKLFSKIEKEFERLHHENVVCK